MPCGRGPELDPDGADKTFEQTFLPGSYVSGQQAHERVVNISSEAEDTGQSGSSCDCSCSRNLVVCTDR